MDYKSDEATTTSNNYYFFILYGISFLFCTLFLFISIKNKLYTKRVTEYMQNILIAEIVICLTKFLCFLKKGVKLKSDDDAVIVIAQLSLDVFSNTATITSTFFIALKIYDSVHHRGSLYPQYSIALWSRTIIASVSAVFSIIVGLIEGLHKEDVDRCNEILCGMNDIVGIIIQVIYLLIMLVVFIIFVKSYNHLKNNFAKIDPNEESFKQKYNLSTKRMIFFPLGSCLLWFLYISYQFILLGIYWIDSKVVEQNEDLIIVMFSFNGLKGLIYSLLCLLMNSDFKKNMPFCALNEEETSSSGLIPN